MFDLARLVLEVDSSAVRLANEALRTLTGRAREAEAAADNNAKTWRRASDVLGKGTRDVKDHDTAIEKNISSWSRWGTVVGTAIGTITGLSIAGMVRELYDVNVQFERTFNTLKFASGDVEGARREYQLLREIAHDLGIDLQSASAGFAQLLASAKGTDISLESIHTLFLGVAEASRALSLSTDQTDGIIKALTQTISKNKLQWEELRGQLGDRMPGAVNLFAKALGVTTEELDGMIKSGIDAKTTVEALGPALVKEFGGSATDAAHSAQSEMARFHNEVKNLYITIGQSGVMSAFADTIGAVGDVLGDPDVQEGAKSIGESIAAMIRSITEKGGAVREFFSFTGDATKGLAADFKTLVDALKAIDDYFGTVGKRARGEIPLTPDTSGMTEGLLSKLYNRLFGSGSVVMGGSAGAIGGGNLASPVTSADGLNFFAPYQAQAFAPIGVEYGSLQFQDVDDLFYGRSRRPSGRYYSFKTGKWIGGSASDIGNELAAPFDHAAQKAEDAFGDMLKRVFSGSSADLKQFGNDIASAVQGAFSQSIAHVIFGQIGLPFGSTGFGGGGGGTLAQQGVSGGLASIFQTPLFDNLSLGQVFGGGLMGYGIGATIGNFSLFGNTGPSAGIGGTIGGLAGSFLGPLGSFGGSLVGGILGSLFGPRKSVGPGQGATLAFDNAARVYGAAADNGGDAGAAAAWAGSIGQMIAQVIQASGGTGLAQPGSVSIFNNAQGFRVKLGGDNTGTLYGSQDEANLAALKYLLSGGIAGGSSTLNQILASGSFSSTADLDQAVTFSKLYDSLVKVGSQSTGAAKAIEDLEKQFADARTQAQRFGLSVSELDAALTQAKTKMRDDFNQSIANQLLAINDQGAAALQALDQQFADIRKDAIALGGDLVSVEKLYGEKRRQIVEQQNGLITDSVANMASDLRKMLDQLTTGPLSALSPADQYAAATSAFAQAEATGRGTGRLPANFGEIMQQFLEASQKMNATTERYADDYDRAVNLLTDLLGLPRRALGGLAAGLTIVGEFGPEVVHLPVGSRVYGGSEQPANDNAEMKRLLQAVGGALAGQSTDSKAMRDLMERLIRRFDLALSGNRAPGARTAIAL